eukprot:SM000026S09002  [mRNA]  locus=s26:910798:912317:- [translate_table: standard]
MAWAAAISVAILLAAALAPSASAWYVSGRVFCDECHEGRFDAGSGDGPAGNTTVEVFCIHGNTTSGCFSGATNELGAFNFEFRAGNVKDPAFGGCYVHLLPGPPGSSCSMVGPCNNGELGKLIVEETTGDYRVVAGHNYPVGDFCLEPQTLPSACPVGPGGKGDPHFHGADGVNFDFTGKPGRDYCLLSDKRLHINTRFEGREDGGNTYTWMKQLAILSGHHSVVLVARDSPNSERSNGYLQSMAIDDAELKLDIGTSSATADGALSVRYIDHGLDGDDDIDRYEVRIAGVAELLLKLRPEVPFLRTSQDSYIHFSLELLSVPGLSSDTHGVLGQSFRPGQKSRTFSYTKAWSPVLQVWQVEGLNGDGYLEGTPDDYVVSGILKADCKYARFDAGAWVGPAVLPAAVADDSDAHDAVKAAYRRLGMFVQ